MGRNFDHVSGWSKGHLILFKVSLGILETKVEETWGDTLKADSVISGKAGHKRPLVKAMASQEMRNNLWFEEKFGTEAEYWIPQMHRLWHQLHSGRNGRKTCGHYYLVYLAFLEESKGRLIFKGITRTQESSLRKISVHFPNSVTQISSGNKTARHYKNRQIHFLAPCLAVVSFWIR